MLVELASEYSSYFDSCDVTACFRICACDRTLEADSVVGMTRGLAAAEACTVIGTL